jgi:hypothetical protein
MSRRWLIHLLLKSAPRSVRPQPLVIAAILSPARSRFAGCRERARKSGRRRAQRGPPGGLGGRVDAAVLCCPTPTRVSTATPSPLQTRATRCRCADSAERAVGRSAPPAAPVQGPLDLPRPRLRDHPARPLRPPLPGLREGGVGPARPLPRTVRRRGSRVRVRCTNRALRDRDGAGLGSSNPLDTAQELPSKSSSAEGEEFEPSVDRKAHNGFETQGVWEDEAVNRDPTRGTHVYRVRPPRDSHHPITARWQLPAIELLDTTTPANTPALAHALETRENRSCAGGGYPRASRTAIVPTSASSATTKTSAIGSWTLQTVPPPFVGLRTLLGGGG